MILTQSNMSITILNQLNYGGKWELFLIQVLVLSILIKS